MSDKVGLSKYQLSLSVCQNPNPSPDVQTGFTLPETNSSPLKMDGWNTSFLLGWPIFRCYVSFREGTIIFVDMSFLKETNLPSKKIIHFAMCSVVFVHTFFVPQQSVHHNII